MNLSEAQYCSHHAQPIAPRASRHTREHIETVLKCPNKSLSWTDSAEIPRKQVLFREHVWEFLNIICEFYIFLSLQKMESTGLELSNAGLGSPNGCRIVMNAPSKDEAYPSFLATE